MLKNTLIGYARVSKADGSQVLDLQIDALKKAGVDAKRIYKDHASGAKDDRPGLAECLRALREGDTLVVYKLDRLGRSLKNLVDTIEELTKRKISFKVLSGNGANIETSTAAGKMFFGIFAALAEYERELIRERTIAGLAAARARGRRGGRKYALTPSQVQLISSAMKDRNTRVGELCKQFGVVRQTVYKYVSPKGELRKTGLAVLNGKKE